MILPDSEGVNDDENEQYNNIGCEPESLEQRFIVRDQDEKIVSPRVVNSAKTDNNEPTALKVVEQVSELFTSVKFAKNDDGSLSIHAPAAAAKTLAAMFDGMAEMFRKSISERV